MTNEQRKIISGLKDLIRDRESFITDEDEKDNIFVQDKKILIEAIELIKEQKNTIAELKEKLILENKAKNKAEEECKRLWYISSSTCYYDMQAEIKKKDKIIGKMIDNIMTHYQVKTIRKMCCSTCKIGERACTYSGIHRNCIKQYFADLVEKEEKQ